MSETDQEYARIIARSDIDAMDKRTRTHFINCLSGFKSANLLGTRSASGASNLSLISSAFHVGANPPLLGMLMRPHTVPRHSLENVLETRRYTLNAVAEPDIAAAHQSTARYPREQSEFAACGFSEQTSDTGIGPYVAQSPLQIGLALVEHHTLACNETVLVVGEILEVRLTRDAISGDGWLDPSELAIAAIAGLDGYYRCEPLGRLPYAKAGTVK